MPVFMMLIAEIRPATSPFATVRVGNAAAAVLALRETLV
jgi:hypothetical protein